MDEREQQLLAWLAASGRAVNSCEQIAGDASFRRYFRIIGSDGSRHVAMDAPPPESTEAFVNVAGALRELGLHVPAIQLRDSAQGFLLLEDLGDDLYLSRLDDGSVDRLYGDALGALLTLQACGSREGLPAYDRPLLERELGIFREWLLGAHLGLNLDGDDEAAWERLNEALVANALEQPQVFVHRDFHSRNLLVTPRHSPGILDFQDAVVGPVTYDLASLLRDCYVSWPAQRVDAWAMGYFELCVQSGVLRQEQEADFLRWFDLTGAQRHLKAAGIFVRLWHRDGKPGYLADIPRTLNYVLQAAARNPELDWIADYVATRVLPGLEEAQASAASLSSFQAS